MRIDLLYSIYVEILNWKIIYRGKNVWTFKKKLKREI